MRECGFLTFSLVFITTRSVSSNRSCSIIWSRSDKVLNAELRTLSVTILILLVLCFLVDKVFFSFFILFTTYTTIFRFDLHSSFFTITLIRRLFKFCFSDISAWSLVSLPNVRIQNRNKIYSYGSFLLQNVNIVIWICNFPYFINICTGKCLRIYSLNVGFFCTMTLSKMSRNLEVFRVWFCWSFIPTFNPGCFLCLSNLFLWYWSENKSCAIFWVL